jgi:adenylate cyclase class IV
MAERDTALAEVQDLTTTLVQETGSATTESGRAKDTAATLAVMTDALAETARERDLMLADATAARAEAEEIALEKRLQEERTDEIFAKLEEAVAVSMEPLDKMFKAAGLEPERVLDQVRRGYSGQGGPLVPLNVSTKGSDPAAGVTSRANSVLNSLDEMNLYRIAVTKAPFAMPLNSAYRITSDFGYRRDPMGRGTRMHEGQDFAGAYGSPILATADGVVITWKGPRLDATAKTRREIELPLAEGAALGAAGAVAGAPATLDRWTELLEALGFRRVREVTKRRRLATVEWQQETIEVALDHVAGLGDFVELEMLADTAGITAAAACIESLAQELGCTKPERRSYLEMLLASES